MARATKRQSIVKAIAEQLKAIDGSGEWITNLHNNVFPRMIFLDEVDDFPTVCLYAGTELREYQTGGFAWRFVDVTIIIYISNQEDPADLLEQTIADIEDRINEVETLTYVENAAAGSNQVVEMKLTSISTDQGAFARDGLAVGEITLEVRY